MSEWLKESGCKPDGYAYAGSNPAPPTSAAWAGHNADVAQLVEHLHGKEGVRGSSPLVGFALASQVWARPTTSCCLRGTQGTHARHVLGVFRPQRVRVWSGRTRRTRARRSTGTLPASNRLGAQPPRWTGPRGSAVKRSCGEGRRAARRGRRPRGRGKRPLAPVSVVRVPPRPPSGRGKTRSPSPGRPEARRHSRRSWASGGNSRTVRARRVLVSRSSPSTTPPSTSSVRSRTCAQRSPSASEERKPE